MSHPSLRHDRNYISISTPCGSRHLSCCASSPSSRVRSVGAGPVSRPFPRSFSPRAFSSAIGFSTAAPAPSSAETHSPVADSSCSRNAFASSVTGAVARAADPHVEALARRQVRMLRFHDRDHVVYGPALERMHCGCPRMVEMAPPRIVLAEFQSSAVAESEGNAVLRIATTPAISLFKIPRLRRRTRSSCTHRTTTCSAGCPPGSIRCEISRSSNPFPRPNTTRRITRHANPYARAAEWLCRQPREGPLPGSWPPDAIA